MRDTNLKDSHIKHLQSIQVGLQNIKQDYKEINTISLYLDEALRYINSCLKEIKKEKK